MRLYFIALFTAATALCGQANAATTQALFSDQTTDQVLFIADLNNDGDVNDPDEIKTFFDASNASGHLFPANNVFQLTQSVTGDVFAGDGATDTVYRLRDLNGNDTAQDEGEATIWFSADNASGLALQTANGIAADESGALYVVEADTRGTPNGDFVYRTVDLNGDGDANDAGESSVWLDLTELDASSSPFEITFDGNVAYITDTAGGAPRIYRAEDLDHNGKVEGDEVSEYVAQGDAPFALSLAVAGADLFAMDIVDDGLLRYRDINGNGVIDASSEAFKLWEPNGNLRGAIFDFAYDGNRALLPFNDFEGNDRLFLLSDRNGDGDFLDTGETGTLLSFSEQGTYPQRPRAVIFYDSVAPVPLPASILLLGAALGVLGMRRKLRV